MKRIGGLALLCASLISPAYAASDILDPLTDWRMSGYNTLKYEYYDDGNYKPNSVFPYDSSQTYNETYLALSREISQYESVALSTRMLASDSEYRHADEGFLFEDIRASWQKGDGSFAPFRLDLGDYTESLSYRTIQQNLKGVQLELQPSTAIAGGDQRHSIIGFYGIRQQDYQYVDFDRDLYAGASWLTDTGTLGQWALHFTHSYREHEPDRSPVPSRSQGVWGVTYEKVFHALYQRIGIEAEVDFFNGDYDTFLTPNGVLNNRTDMGYFFNLNSASELLDYGFRFEQYGDDYRPNGAVITPNRRTFSWTAGRRVFQDIRLDGRIENFRDDWESENSTETMVEGLALSGPLSNSWLPDLSAYLNVFREDRDSDDRFTDTVTWNYLGDFNATVYREWTGHFGYNIRNIDDNGFDYGAIYREFTQDIGRPVRFGPAPGDFRIGLIARQNSGLPHSTDLNPFASVSASHGKHRGSVRAMFLNEDSHQFFGQDVASVTLQGGYSYESGPHRFAIDVDMLTRNPYTVVTPSTEDYRVAFTYTFSFDKPAGTPARDFSWPNGYQPAHAVLEAVDVESPSHEISVLDAAAPGRTIESLEPVLKEHRIGKARRQGDFLIYEARLFADIHERQRLVVEEKDGRIVRSAILIDLDRSGDPAKAERTYETVRGALLKRYNQPTADFSEGSFGKGYATAIQAGTLVRAVDWQAPAGMLRAGLPPQGSRPARLEIQYAGSLGARPQENWGLDL